MRFSDVNFEVLTALSVTCVVRYMCLIFILRRRLFLRIYIFFDWMSVIRGRTDAGMILIEDSRRTWRETYSSATLSTTNPTRRENII